MTGRYHLTLPLVSLVSSAALGQTAIYDGTTLVGDQASETLEVGDFFGDRVASNDDWLMISAPREDIDFDNDGLDQAQGDKAVGAVYVYKRTPGGPVLHQKIVGQRNNRDPDTDGDRFGAGLELSGNTLFVGAANDNSFPGFVDPIPDPAQEFFFAGQVYVYNYDGGSDMWELTQRLTSDEPNSDGSFGARTSSGHFELFSFGQGQQEPTIALIGEIENGSGFAPILHVFRRFRNTAGTLDRWVRVQKVDAPSAVVTASFADSVEGVGNLALVTEGGLDFPLDPAAVHVYRVSRRGIQPTDGSVLPVQTLNSPNGPDDLGVCQFGFGSGLDAAEDIVAIGSPCDNTAGQAAGAVFVYTVDDPGSDNPLSFVQTLTSPNAKPFGSFSVSFSGGKQNVTTDGNLILVGTANATFDPSLSDDVHLFARDAGADTFSLADSVPSPAPGFPGYEVYGQSVTLLGGNRLAISQMSEDPVDLILKGRVFLFDILP